MIWFLSLALLVPLPIDEEASEAKAPEPPKLAFKDDASRASFVAGFDKFQAGQWKEAGSDFRTALKGVEKSDKKTLQVWVNAAKDGPKTDEIGDLLMEEKYRKAYSKLLKLETKHADGPLAPRLDVFLKELDQTLFHVLEDYEGKTEIEQDQNPGGPGGQFRGMFGNSEINKDPDYARRGKQSLKWSASGGKGTFGYSLAQSFVRLDRDLLEEYRYLNFFIHGPRKEAAKVVVSVDTASNPNIRAGTNIDKSKDIATVQIRPKQWTEVRIDLRSAKVRKLLEENEVHGFKILMATPKSDQVMYIDEVKLEIP